MKMLVESCSYPHICSSSGYTFIGKEVRSLGNIYLGVNFDRQVMIEMTTPWEGIKFIRGTVLCVDDEGYPL